jgi:hypothetical protein
VSFAAPAVTVTAAAAADASLLSRSFIQSEAKSSLRENDLFDRRLVTRIMSFRLILCLILSLALNVASGNNTTDRSGESETTTQPSTDTSPKGNTSDTGSPSTTSNSTSCTIYNYPDKIVCGAWNEPNHPLFQVGNLLIVISLLALFMKPSLYWHLYERFFLSAGCWALTVWAWTVHCFPDIVIWNFLFGLMHLYYVINLMFKLRPARYFQPVIENVRRSLFSSAPLHAYHRMIRYADLERFQKGEKILVQGHETLRLITTGKVQASANGHNLYSAAANQFADSPSRVGINMMPITLTMVEETEFLKWESAALHEINRDPELAPILNPVVSADAAHKMTKAVHNFSKPRSSPAVTMGLSSGNPSVSS